MSKSNYLYFYILLFFLSFGFLQTAELKNEELRRRRVISLIDYIRGDYQEAVENGKVINQDEFIEMKTFAVNIREQLNTLATTQKKSKNLSEAQETIEKLILLINDKAKHSDILDVSLNIKNLLIKSFKLNMSPKKRLISSQTGKKLYQTYCSSCHGTKGQGDGPAALGLEPPAKNFHDESIRQAGSIAKNFNILLTGIPDTSMSSYSFYLRKNAGT